MDGVLFFNHVFFSELEKQGFNLRYVVVNTNTNPKSLQTLKSDTRILHELYDFAAQQVGSIPTLIEWDQDFPPLQTLLDEANRARAILNKYEAAHAAE